MWLTSRATAAFICVIACSIGVQTVQFKYWEYRPSNCDAVAAAVATADCDGLGCRATEGGHFTTLTASGNTLIVSLKWLLSRAAASFT